MKRTFSPSSRCWTSSTTSTTGPHVRLEQNFGVAKVTTNGTFAAIESATEYFRSDSSGGVRVVIAAASPPTDDSVGVSDGIAGSPTSGGGSFFTTTTFPSACTFALPPSGSASIQYFPGRGSLSVAT